MKKILITTLVIIIGILVLPRLYHTICWQIYLMNPNIVEQKEEAYQGLSSDELIKKLGPWNVWWFDTALNILAERKETKAIPRILEMLKSPYKYRRDSAIRALARISDKRAIEPLMEIVNKGKSHLDYYNALLALSQLRYEGAYNHVLQLAKAHNGHSVLMLKEYAKPETIPLLEAMKDEINADDLANRIKRKQIDEVIKHIKSQ